jgi:hypothetical protein
MVRERTESKFIKRILLMMVIMALLIIGASVGLSWAVAIYTKDTQVRGCGQGQLQEWQRGAAQRAGRDPQCRL